MLKTIILREHVDEAQNKFERIIKTALPYETEKIITYQSGKRTETVYYNDSGFWFATNNEVKGAKRYWNPLGIKNVEQSKYLNIIVELNFPMDFNRRVAGVFLINDNKEIYIGHRGKIGGGKTGVGKNAFMRYYIGDRAYINDNGQEAEILLISRLDSSQLVNNLKKFVIQVGAFKDSM